MKGVKPVFEAKVFTTSGGGPGYYTPFSDKMEGWDKARKFMEWMLGHPYRASFNNANLLARKEPEKFKAWYAMMVLKGEK